MGILRKTSGIITAGVLLLSPLVNAETIEKKSPATFVGVETKKKDKGLPHSNTGTVPSTPAGEFTSASLLGGLASPNDKSILYRSNSKFIRFAKNGLPVFIDINDPVEVTDKHSDVFPFIVGGEPTPPDERGYQVSLSVAGQHVCGGSLIADEWVLTAAHCVSADIVRDGIEIVLGTQVLQGDDALVVPVTQIVAHEEFNLTGEFENDIAIVRLAVPAPESIPRLSLADAEIMANFGNEGDISTVSGWGAINNDGDAPDQLMQVNLPIYNQQACADAYFDEMGALVMDTMLCAGQVEGGTDSCFGDSGGPLTVQTPEGEYSIGIVSWGVGSCAEPGFPGVYTRTASYVDWVAQAMQTPPLPERIEGNLLDLITVSVDVDAGSTALVGLIAPLPLEWIIEFLGGEGLEARVYKGFYPLDDALACEISIGPSSACDFPLTNSGYYLIELVNNTDTALNTLIANTFSSIFLEDGSVYSGFDVLEGEVIAVPFEITEAGMDLDVYLFADNGDADLFIFPEFDSEWSCASANFDTEENCFGEDMEPGLYTLFIVGFNATQDITLEFNLTPGFSALPPAICQHSVITQFGQFFIAAITVTNVSGEFLENWWVTWAYENPMDVVLIQNGIITSTDPYVAMAQQPGLAIAPGSSAQIYMLVRSPNRVAENPTVGGNYCGFF